MAVIITHNIEELELDALIAQGYTTIKLYYASTPDGVYADSGATPDPATLAESNTDGPPHEFTFEWASGSPAYWYKVLAFDGASLSDINDSQAFHGGGGTTLKTLRQRLGKMTKTMFVGQTTSAGNVDGTTLICSHARFSRFPDDYFGGFSGADGWSVYIPSTGSWSQITDWVQSTSTFTVSPALSAQIGSGTEFEVSFRFTPEDYKDAINWAIVDCFPILYKPIIDLSIYTEDDLYQYQVPQNIRIVNKVEMESTSNSDSTDSRTKGMPWQEIPFEIIDDGLIRTFEFKNELAEDRRLRIHGTSILTQLYNESDYVEAIDPQIDLILYRAAHKLYADLANTAPSTDVNRYKEQATYYQSLFVENKTKRSRRRRSQRIWGHDARWGAG